MQAKTLNKLSVQAGNVFDGYRLTECIGKGGFAEVWSAWNERLKRVVAVKLIPLSDHDGHSVIQFKREATLVSRLEHPHILPLYDFGDTPDFCYLVMRYVTGGSLAQRISTKRLPIPDLLRLMRPVAATLDYLHEQRVVHRDLKPANILLDAQETPYLVDFGLAKSLSETTTPMHSMTGTMHYMPPEQFTGQLMSIQSDQYSFGIMLYQLFTGTLPNDGLFSFGLHQVTSDEALPDVTLTAPELPPKLNDYLRALTASRQDERPRSASATLEAIAALFETQESAPASTAVLAFTKALESTDYRQHEAESLLNGELPAWEQGHFTLSHTHYMLLDMLLPGLPDLLRPEVRSLMIRGELEYNTPSQWWSGGSEAVQQRACWHALRFGRDDAWTAAIRRAGSAGWIAQTPDDILDIIGQRLLPLSPLTALGLAYLDRALPVPQNWPHVSPGVPVPIVDQALQQIAVMPPTDPAYHALSERAGQLIGRHRRSAALALIPFTVTHLEPLLTVFEESVQLPSTLPILQRSQLMLALAFRQVTGQPLSALRNYGWSAAGNGIGFGLILFVIGLPRFRNTVQLLNQTISYGLVYGLLLGAGVWLACHLSERLKLLRWPIRVGLGVIAGGMLVALAFSLYNRVALDNVVDPAIALYSGLLYVGGFAVSRRLTMPMQIFGGALGIMAALLVPWLNYTQNDLIPVLDFGDLRIVTVLVLVAVAGVIVSTITLMGRMRRSRPTN